MNHTGWDVLHNSSRSMLRRFYAILHWTHEFWCDIGELNDLQSAGYVRQVQLARMGIYTQGGHDWKQEVGS